MALKRKASSQPQYSNDVDFRCPTHDAWHIVKLAKVEGVLRVIYVNFFDELYYSDQFESLDEIEELLGRIRLPAKPLQDSQCGQVYEGMVVLASHEFPTGKLLFHDATVDSVSRSEHRANDGTEEKECTCKFSLKWKHGPRMGKNDTVGIEDVCLIEELPVDDPVLEDFIDSARKSLEERMGNLVNQGGSSGANPTNFPKLIDVDHSDDGSPHHQVDDDIGQTKDRTGTLGEEKDVLEEQCCWAEAEVARLKAEHARAASAWEKEKSKFEGYVEHLEGVLAEELYFQKEIKRYEGLLQERDAQLQIFRAQMQVVKAEREQAILALYEVEAKLKRKRFKVDKSAAEWKIPEHLTLPPSETVLSTIRNSQEFAPFRRQIEKEIREHVINEQHNARSPLK
ncbi:uncharacterized protein LOC144566665 [Carex rostrata]